MRDTDAEKKLFTTEHTGLMKIAKQMTEVGVGIDFFMAAPQGGYLDIAAIGIFYTIARRNTILTSIGYVSEKTGGEVYYYPNFHSPRDNLRLSKEIKHTVTRETGFQALMKVRCSNGLQVSGYLGNFTQHTVGADLEFGVIDADKVGKTNKQSQIVSADLCPRQLVYLLTMMANWIPSLMHISSVLCCIQQRLANAE